MYIFRVLISLILVGALGLAGPVGASIGMVMARGSFRIDNSSVSGNTTLLDGSTVETARAGSELILNSGVRMLLAAGSLCRVYRDRAVFEKGQAQVEHAAAYRVEARGLRIFPDATARVTLSGPNLVHVAALTGAVRITRPDGLLLARVEPGRALEFEPQPGAAAAFLGSGVLRQQDGRFLLTDETSGVTVELVGPDLAANVGKRIQVKGAIDPGAKAAAGATQVVRAAQVTVLGSAAPAAAGLSPLAKKAIIAGVVIGGAAVGAGIAASRGGPAPVSP